MLHTMYVFILKQFRLLDILGILLRFQCASDDFSGECSLDQGTMCLTEPKNTKLIGMYF